MEGLSLQYQAQAKPQGEKQAFSPYHILRPATELTAELQNSFQEFWNLAPGLRLFSISQTPHYFWHMQDFYVAQKGLDEEGKHWAQLRISEGLCQFLFETTLGKAPNEPEFTLAQIRNFEVYLLERFSRKLFQNFSPALLKRPDKKAPAIEHEKLVHMVWVVGGAPELVSQIILTAPSTCLKIPKPGQEPQPQIWNLADATFLHAHTQVTFQVGRTTARLEELQQLEAGDVIVLENSKSSQWNLLDPISQQWLPVAVQVPDRFKIPDLSSTQGAYTMANEMQMKQNIWDNLQVEVSAAFTPVKMPLKQLKEMEQGLVVEVGDLMDNRIQIEVEGHPVAWGELLVIGDKYGVRIQGLHDAVDYVDQTSAAVSPVSSTPSEEAANSSSGEAFGDDSNEIMDLDLDESDFDDLDDEEDWS